MNRLIATSLSPVAEASGGAHLLDRFGRHKQKLRISLTDRCNFHCSYCMPDHPEWLHKQNFLQPEEWFNLAQLMVGMGIRHIRLTGGEPLLRQDVTDCVQSLARLKEQGLERLSMTTNGYYLSQHARALKQAGLDDLNVSLDSIDHDTFRQMTGQDLQPVLDGIDAARQAGLPVKLNCVLVAGQNDADVVSLTRWACRQQLPLRFIEYMPLDQPGNWEAGKVISEDHIIAELACHFAIEKMPRSSNPATLYRLDGTYELGIISTISKPFCQTCDRLRLTADGDLYTCLFASHGTPLRSLLRAGDTAMLQEAISHAVWNKDAGFIAGRQAPAREASMHQLGG